MILAALILAHSWYPQSCCGGVDCHPVPCSEISEISDKDYHFAWKGIKFETATPSQDGECHVCVHEGNGLCLFMAVSS